jgi:predicted phage terminase large subunit-like protein
MIISPHEFDAIMKKDLMSFIHRCFNEQNPETQFLSNWHIEQIAAKLEQVAQGKITRLIINLPPRNLKSIAASVSFPAWFLGHNPSKHIIAASYGQDLANKFARDTRAIMLTPWYQRVFPTRVSLQQRAADDFATVQGGSRMATSVGGTLTGRGADIIVIDDAMKPEDALSEVVRTRANSWFDSTVLSRLNNKETGAIVIIMQRLHQDDLVGHVLEQAANWEVLSFPAIAERDELHVIENSLGRRTVVRKAGEALHAARESVAGLEAQRRSMGDYNFSAQYQQNPAPEGGAMVKLAWIRYYVPGEEPAKFDRIVQSWDTANKSTELNDFSACTTWGIKDKHYFLLHVLRKRMDYPELKKTVIAHAKYWKATGVVIEDKASGTQLIQDLRADLGNYFLKPYEPPAGMDKKMRLHAQTLAFENGQVLLPTHAPWLEDYRSELIGFPGAKYDDQVDSTTQALAYLSTPSVAEKLMRAYGD